MKIISAPDTGNALTRHVESFDFADGELRVKVVVEPAEQGRGGFNSTGYYDSVPVPASLLSPDPIPAIEAWLVGSEGPFAGELLVDEADAALATRRLVMLRDVRLRRNALQAAGAQTPYGLVDTNMESILKLVGAVVMALASQAAGVEYQDVWTMFDGTDVDVDAPTITAIGMAAGAHVSACQRRKKALDRAILDAETIEELDALDILSGWPAA